MSGQPTATQNSIQLLRLPEVLKIYPVSRPTLYRRIRDGKFPRPYKDGVCSLWDEREVMEVSSQLQKCPPKAACYSKTIRKK